MKKNIVKVIAIGALATGLTLPKDSVANTVTNEIYDQVANQAKQKSILYKKLFFW